MGITRRAADELKAHVYAAQLRHEDYVCRNCNRPLEDSFHWWLCHKCWEDLTGYSPSEILTSRAEARAHSIANFSPPAIAAQKVADDARRAVQDNSETWLTKVRKQAARQKAPRQKATPTEYDESAAISRMEYEELLREQEAVKSWHRRKHCSSCGRELDYVDGYGGQCAACAEVNDGSVDFLGDW